MSESQAKASRREVKRALGIEASDALSRQAEALGFIGDAVRRQTASLGALALDIGEMKLRLTQIEHRIELLETFVNARTWRERLRWIATGR